MTFLRGSSRVLMADNPQEMTTWNLRPFPLDIKRECNVRAAKEGEKDWKWLADYLRKVLPLIETSEVEQTTEQQPEIKTKGRPLSRRSL